MVVISKTKKYINEFIAQRIFLKTYYRIIRVNWKQLSSTIIHNIDDKFKILLTQQMKESINNCVDYYDQDEQHIPAKALLSLSLKRFICRFLLIYSNIENLNLNMY